MEIWGHCGDCKAWFPCPLGDAALAGWSCPQCGAEPDAIVNRAVQVRVAGAHPAGADALLTLPPRSPDARAAAG